MHQFQNDRCSYGNTALSGYQQNLLYKIDSTQDSLRDDIVFPRADYYTTGRATRGS